MRIAHENFVQYIRLFFLLLGLQCISKAMGMYMVQARSSSKLQVLSGISSGAVEGFDLNRDLCS